MISRGGAWMAVCATMAIASVPMKAWAQDPTPTATPDLEPPPAPLPPLPRWSVGVNPLAFLLGRFGGDVEYSPAPYVALVGNVHVDSSAVFTNSATSPYWGFGGEAGVRAYVNRSLFGVFMGPSLVGGYYSVNYYGQPFALPDVGVAFDIGAKARITRSTGFIACGAGVQRLWSRSYPSDFGNAGTVLGGGNWPLRLLVTVGATFR
ncbi:MAG: hypothetical protein ACRENE_16730 [Polyangiaceae bacterium]